MIRKILFLCAFGMVYTVGAAFLFVTTMGAAMSGFEPGTVPVGRVTWRVLSTLTELVMLPFGPLLGRRGAPGLWGYALIFTNGLAWGAMALGGWHAIKHARRHHAKPA